ncbi:hypothetical protein GMMP15_680008 [Candidatus Magnetomoraceae bacterium gMMP-15]
MINYWWGIAPYYAYMGPGGFFPYEQFYVNGTNKPNLSRAD